MGCGTHAAKAELQRFVVAGGRVEPDPQQRRPGRGAYVCDAACARAALQRNAFARAFRANVHLDPDLVDSS